MTGDSAQAKGAIDSGRTGDKVPGFDPAAAPLGTDDEAGGARAGYAAGAIGAVQHGSPPNASHPPLAPNGDKPKSPMTGPVAIGIGAAVALGVALLLVLA